MSGLCRLFRAELWLLALLLGGCSLSPPQPVSAWSPPAWPAWQLEGRIALTAGEQGWHAGLLWRQDRERYRLRLSGPFGQGALLLEGDAGGVVLREANGREQRASDAEALLYRTTGWELPLAGLRYWVRAQVQPGLPFELQRDAMGRPLRLRQGGWRIDYRRYRRYGDGELPALIRLSTDGVSVRLVIDDWRRLEAGA
ncbi:lipoprotein insertase outer membrane protein LolB [Thiohalobacter sp. IOR34]|uniref:lipoprotein insertase outer membrane protein LolB n=1 Tax=Thiohalobacter sp. IOR34 TaxID=3057176 RepID=UPI0025AF8EDE|nr:lipoprotein insertase outer membrane protein LolB [Thiohalobacter sp. IOR34]WJW75947.1 lipoprotein insertase outer membrane protein LolB [Thiohalobacter sp. IOR34]